MMAHGSPPAPGTTPFVFGTPKHSSGKWMKASSLMVSEDPNGSRCRFPMTDGSGPMTVAFSYGFPGSIKAEYVTCLRSASQMPATDQYVLSGRSCLMERAGIGSAEQWNHIRSFRKTSHYRLTISLLSQRIWANVTKYFVVSICQNTRLRVPKYCFATRLTE